MEIPFQDREDELEILRRLVGARSDQNQVILISADHGVGKSTLTGHALKGRGAPSIRVKVIGGASRFVESGFFIVKIAEAINSAAKQRPDSTQYGDFSRGQVLHDTAARLARTARSAAAEWVPVVGKDLMAAVEQTLGAGEFDETTAFGSRVGDRVKLFERYIRFILSNTSVILIIENIQFIDEYSLRFLQDTIFNLKGQMIFMEFTENISSAVTISDLIQTFEEIDCNVVARRLERLPKTDLGSIAQLLNKQIDDFKQFYEAWDGNLWTFTRVDTFGTRDRGSISDENAGRLRAATLALPGIPKFLLFLVITHNGVAPIPALLDLALAHIPDSSAGDFETAIAFLSRHGLCSTGGGDLLSVDHDTLADLFPDNRSREIYTSNSLWLRYYIDKLYDRQFEFISRNDAILKIVDFMVKLRDFSVLDWIASEAAEVAAGSPQPRRLLLRILEALDGAQAATVTRSSDLDQARMVFARTAYDLRHFGEALQILGPVKHRGASIFQVSSQIGEEQLLEGLEACDRSLKEVTDTSERCAFLLLKMVALRSLNRIQDSRHLFTTILRSFRHSGIPEFGYVLRASEYNCSVPKSLPFIEWSVEHFSRRDLVVEKAFSQNALANQYLRLGRVVEALGLYESALKALPADSADHRTIRHNHACVSAVTGEDLETAEAALTTLLACQQNKFNRAVVLLNRGVVRAKAGAFDRAGNDIRYSIRLMQAGNVTDAEVIALAHWNEWRVRLAAGDESDRPVLAFDPATFGTEVEQLWQARLFDVTPELGYLRFLAGWQFTPILLSHWLPEFSYL